MTPSQERIWQSLPIQEDFPPVTPTRRRLVDKLKEEKARTPERNRSSPVRVFDVGDEPRNLDDEISRILGKGMEERAKSESQGETQGTYLSRARSFLAESTSVEGGIPGLDEIWHVEEMKMEIIDEEEDLDPGVKSWHELKRGGEDKRLVDEMEDLIEECKVGKKMSLRRSSVVQIVGKLLNDANRRRKFKELGLMSSFISNVADAGKDLVSPRKCGVNQILLTVTLLVIYILPKPVPGTVTAESSRICLTGLQETRDLATLSSLRSLGLTKLLKQDLLGLESRLLSMDTLPKMLSPHNLATGVLADLSVSDISPLLSFLEENWEREQWGMLSSISQCLEKSTQGRVINDLNDRDVQVLTPLLKQGISEFETDGMASYECTN
jgi:Wings apart-like protein regulation of heterochromatin